MKNYRLAWSISLIIIALTNILILISNNTAFNLPDGLTRLFGVLDLCSIVVLVYTTVKMRQ